MATRIEGTVTDLLNGVEPSKMHTVHENGPYQPSACAEIDRLMQTIRDSAIDLLILKAKRSSINTGREQSAIKRLYRTQLHKLGIIRSNETLGDLSPGADNTEFLKDLKQATKLLRQFANATAKIADTDLKTLDAEGHKRRSQGRNTLVSTFPAREDGWEQFVIYLPAGRFTDVQRQGIDSDHAEEIPRDHATTSHHRKGGVIGNASFVRMIVGKRKTNPGPDDRPIIQHDSFSGPGARMPYKDLGKNKYQDMAVKAITLMNQHEIIQAMAQRQADRGLTPTMGVLREVYTQVTSPGQGWYPFADGGDHNREQFEFVRDAISAFDGAIIPVHLKGRADPINVTYQGRHFGFGVNAFRSSNDSVAKAQNTRAINQLIDDTLIDCTDKLALPEVPGDPDLNADIRDILNNIKQIFDAPVLQALKRDIDKLKGAYGGEQSLQNLKNDYRAQLIAFHDRFKRTRKEHHSELDPYLTRLMTLESKIKAREALIDAKYQQMEAARKPQLENLNLEMTALKTAIEPRLKAETPDDEKEKLISVYNQLAYLRDGLELYYSGNWAKSENNFKLQALIAANAEARGDASTKGCKSNNDRGQRLAQKIALLSMVTASNPNGLYAGNGFVDKTTSPKSTKRILDKSLVAIQAMHHIENTSVAGGKFVMRDKANFSDNGLLSKIAKLAKLPSLNPSWKKYAKTAAITALVIGAVATIAPFLPVVGPAILGAGLATAALAGIGVGISLAVGGIVAGFKKLFDKQKQSQSTDALIENAKTRVLKNPAHRDARAPSPTGSDSSASLEGLHASSTARILRGELGRRSPSEEVGLLEEYKQGSSLEARDIRVVRLGTPSPIGGMGEPKGDPCDDFRTDEYTAPGVF